MIGAGRAGRGRRSPARAAAVRLAGELARPCGALCPRGPRPRRGGDRGGVRRACSRRCSRRSATMPARVRWQAGDVSYGRLGAMFEGFRRFLAEQRAAGVPMRLLAQNDALGTQERMAAYLRFEAMANEVYSALRLPLGLPVRHPRPLHRRRCASPARSTPGCSNPRAERSPTTTTSSPAPTSPGPGRRRHRHRLRCSSTSGDRSGRACGLPAPAAPVGRPHEMGDATPTMS